MNPRYDVWNDYRLVFLSRMGVIVNYLYSEFDQDRGHIHKLLNTLMQASYDTQKRLGSSKRGPADMLVRLLTSSLGSLGTIFYKIMRSLYYNKTWARAILEKTGARVICFDHIMPQRYVVSSFLRAAGEMSIPALSLPHGVMLYTNENTKPKSTNWRRRSKFAFFDYVLVPNQLRKDLLIRTGIPDDKIFVFGSARYCKEWLEQNKRILPRLIDTAQSGVEKLKVVFMQSKPQCRVDLERMSTTFKILADLPEIQVMVKPHTRSAEETHLFDETHLMDASHILTAELCEWADVLLVVGSSVITEALMQRKPALYLKYLHKNTTLFEDLGACWVISDEQALKKALSILQKNRKDIPYDEKDVSEYLTEVVGGGDSSRDVLNEYKRFIVNCASDKGLKNYIYKKDSFTASYKRPR
jgi:UDP-N-acetylglucosamine:LPS N-acetylglucosamine transferase